MNDDTLKELAEKLGTTAKEAWPRYVYYVWIEGLATVVFGSLLAVLAIWIARRDTGSYDEGAAAIKWIVAGVVVMLAVVCIAAGLPALLAPEGAAIAKILKH